MLWEKVRDEPAGAMVVRALSFTTRTEDGSVVQMPSTDYRPRTVIRPQPSFTSIDVKKSRRVARRPTTVLKTPPTNDSEKSSTLPHNANPSMMVPLETSTPRGTAMKTQSLGRPARVNKLVLRVPSAASEYQHRRVIHSQVTSDDNDDVPSPPLVSQASQTNLGGLPTIHCDSSVCSKTHVPQHHDVFPPDQDIFTITPRAAVEQWRSGTGAISDAASASISNLSSGDGVSSSTFSRLSHHLNYDGLSTSTHMGSTTRLVPKNAKTQERCKSCVGSEHIATAFAVLSFAGTLGNLLRLPRLVYFHGGGVFLLIYVLEALVFGIPLTFLEIGLGQFCQHGAVKLWRAVNLFRGVGYAKVLLSFVLAVCYSTQIASALALLVFSVNEPADYSDCSMSSMLNSAKENGSESRSERCIIDTVLAPANDQPAWFGVRLLFAMLIWTLVLVCLMKRSTTYRRANYVFFPAFFVILVGLLVETSYQPGAELDRLLRFDWTAFGDIEVWYLATVQMFFSLQVGFGNLNTCAGRIYPKSNAVWTAVALVICNVTIGVLCTILVYMWAAMAPISDGEIPVPQAFVLLVMYNVSAISTNTALWLCLTYVMVLLAGICSMMGLIYTVLVATAVETKRKCRWRYINASVCLTACLLAILALIPGLLEISEGLEYYGIGRCVMALTIMELIGLAGVYGCSNLYNDLEFVIGSKLSSAWKSLWILTPILLTALEIASAVLLPAREDTDSLWQAGLGWGLYTLCWLLIIVTAAQQVSQQVDYNLAQKFVSAVKPSRNWGPIDPIYRHCWVQWRNRYNLTGTRDFTLKRRGTRDYTHHARTGTPVKADPLPWHMSTQ